MSANIARNRHPGLDPGYSLFLREVEQERANPTREWFPIKHWLQPIAGPRIKSGATKTAILARMLRNLLIALMVHGQGSSGSKRRIASPCRLLQVSKV
jgi:hypothetical protein